MRVLLFRMLCDRGGVSSSMLLLGEEMAKRGIEHEFWFCKPSTRLSEFMETGRATLAPLSKLAARLERGDFDVVQMTASDPGAEVISMMAHRTKVLVSARGALSDIWDHSNCFAYSAISQGMADVNQPYTDVEIEVVRNAINLDRFSPDPTRANGAGSGGGRPIVAFVGRTSDAIKDFPRFTRIARRLADHGARVWIADPHNAEWKHFANLPVEQMPVERWGPVAHSEIAEFYRAVAASGGVVLMTSRSEGFGNVAPEAAACGARVVAPDVMGLREAVLDGITGNLFPADATDDDAAELIRGWMSLPQDTAARADAARRAFAPSGMMDGYQRIYERREQRLVSKASTPPAAAARLDHLREHLVKQRQWRAAAATEAAAGLAREGHKRLALGALRLAYRAAPRQLVSRSGSREVLSTALRVAGLRGAR